MFDVYIRVSRTGERSDEEATEAYESQCRSWADRHDHLEVDQVMYDTDVSGARAVGERGLEQLIQRVERGESEGIITPYLDRFGRDLIEGALAYKRIDDADGRLICTEDGLDSKREGNKLQFNIRMAFAEDYLDRVRDNWDTAYDKAVAEGWWLAPRVPFGYRKVERKLVVDEAEARIIRELFRRRTDGENWMSLLRWMKSRGATATRTRVRSIVGNRVYLGETSYARGRKDNPIIKQTHVPILTEHEWEAAQHKQEFSPRNGRAAGALMRGLVFCATCGHRCKVGASGRADRGKVPTYVCTNAACDRHAGILASKLDGYVDGLLLDAAMLHEPHVESILLGDTRYRDAMRAVDEAKRALAEYRDSTDLQLTLGMSSWTDGLRARRKALDLARSELRRVRPASRRERPDLPTTEPIEEYERLLRRHDFQRYVERVVLRPTPDRRERPAAERADVYWVGADEPWKPDYVTA